MFGNMGNMMKQFNDLKKQMNELKKMVVEVSSKNNEVTVKCSGELKIIDLKIADNVPAKQLPALVKETVNKALQEVTVKSASQFKGLEGLNIPGLT
jgi:DNA-binding protein YbaB